MEYTVRQFRMKIKEAMDLAEKGEKILVFRRNDCFLLKLSTIQKTAAPDRQEVKVSLKLPNTYGCKCERVEGKALCPKHSRL